MPESVWREVGGVPQKRCPTCEERGRDPWHVVEEFGRDTNRNPPIAIRCLECVREDGRRRWSTMKADHPETYERALESNARRVAENPEQERARQSVYHQAKRAAGWRKVKGRWVKEGDDDG